MLRFVFVAGIELAVVYLALRRSLRARSAQTESASPRTEHQRERTRKAASCVG